MKAGISVQPIAEFLHSKLHVRARAHATHFTDDTLWYLGQMLESFVAADQLFVYQHGELQVPTLAYLYRDASATESNYQRCVLLRKLGDTALFMGALFDGHYKRRGIGRDYFVGMGVGAYQYLADNFDNANSAFLELSCRFPAAIELVAEVCEKESVVDAQDILHLYSQWAESKSSSIQRQLEALGITVSCSDQLH